MYCKMFCFLQNKDKKVVKYLPAPSGNGLSSRYQVNVVLGFESLAVQASCEKIKVLLKFKHLLLNMHSCKIIPVTIHQHERALVFPKSHFLEALKKRGKRDINR